MFFCYSFVLFLSIIFFLSLFLFLRFFFAFFFFVFLLCFFFFFFFQAEDGIRDIGVTGVQTCALPISSLGFGGHIYPFLYTHVAVYRGLRAPARLGICVLMFLAVLAAYGFRALGERRSEERRVGKECRSRGWPYHKKKKRVKECVSRQI